MITRSIAILSVVLALPLFAGAPKPEDEKAVLAAEKAWAVAMIHGDKAALERLLGDDLSYTHSSSRTESKADVLQAIGSGAANYQSIEFRDTKVRQYGSVVVTTQKAAIKTKQSGVANLYLTHVWTRQREGWQLVSRQATRLPE